MLGNRTVSSGMVGSEGFFWTKVVYYLIDISFLELFVIFVYLSEYFKTFPISLEKRLIIFPKFSDAKTALASSTNTKPRFRY